MVATRLVPAGAQGRLHPAQFRRRVPPCTVYGYAKNIQQGSLSAINPTVKLDAILELIVAYKGSLLIPEPRFGIPNSNLSRFTAKRNLQTAGTTKIYKKWIGTSIASFTARRAVPFRRPKREATLGNPVNSESTGAY